MVPAQVSPDEITVGYSIVTCRPSGGRIAESTSGGPAGGQVDSRIYLGSARPPRAPPIAPRSGVRARPDVVNVTCLNNSVMARQLRWSSWGGPIATATGSAVVDLCAYEDCAACSWGDRRTPACRPGSASRTGPTPRRTRPCRRSAWPADSAGEAGPTPATTLRTNSKVRGSGPGWLGLGRRPSTGASRGCWRC